MKKQSLSSQTEQLEFEKIQKKFPGARLKSDYNREILDVGAEITIGETTFILLKGDQTNHCYELITPECKCFEGIESLEQVFDICQKLIEENVENRHEMTSENGRNE